MNIQCENCKVLIVNTYSFINKCLLISVNDKFYLNTKIIRWTLNCCFHLILDFITSKKKVELEGRSYLMKAL